jgi:hypothetical protein
MPVSADRTMEIELYLARLETLYGCVERWVRSREPATRFTRTDVELSEEFTGPYKAKSLEIARAGRTAIRLIPRGIFMVGAHGRVDARSRLGREILVWVEKSGPDMRISLEEGGKLVEDVFQPLYPGVEEGWAWGDEQRRGLLHLSEDVFWTNVVVPLSE